MYIRRDVEDYIRSASSSFQAIVIYGPRQVGKSTTVDMIFGDKFNYVTNNSIYPIEIKKGQQPTKPTKNFNVLSKYGMEIKPGLIIDTCDAIRPINDKAYSFPVFLLGN